MSIRVAYFGNSQNVFSNRHFAALMEAPCAIVGLIDAPAGKRGSTNAQESLQYASFIEIGKRKRIPIFKPDNPNMPEFVERMEMLKPDLFIAVGYTNLLKDALLSIPRLLSVNFHASLLPAYRGKSPLFWALRHREKWAGLTVHAMDPGLDTGDIIYQVKVRTRKSDSVGTLYDRIMDKSTGLILRLISEAKKNRVPRSHQNHSQGSYFSGAKEEDFQIDWKMPANAIRAWINATPGKCWTLLPNGTRLYFSDAVENIGTKGKKAGTILKIGRLGGMIAAEKEAVFIKRGSLNNAQMKPLTVILKEESLLVGSIFS
jgi:methionyl-tRNA formyltransferase